MLYELILFEFVDNFSTLIFCILVHVTIRSEAVVCRNTCSHCSV